MQSNQKLELNKILSSCANYASLNSTKEYIKNLAPSSDIEAVRESLAITEECDKLLFSYGVGKVEYFDDVQQLLVRAEKGSALSCAELISVNCLLRSARAAYQTISGVDDGEVIKIKRIADRLYFDENLENDIADKIISDDAVSDFASDALHTIRTKIKSLNERIRATLSDFVTGSTGAYLQDGIVTMRGDRYVIPVKAEHKGKIKGLVHDRSQSGATYFIEPEYVLNLNNELVALSIDEKQEVERILKQLSSRVGAIAQKLLSDIEALTQIDSYFARAEYGYFIKGVCPKINKRGYVNIIKGRHPLIDKDKVVPVSVELGGGFSFLLLSGANTGGKTVTLKMVGLFCLMAECGLYIPAAAGSEVCAFKNVFCDLGDSQSIEDSLSTFSSHITNVIDVCNRADGDSLVLIDELGGGTNPDEGQALARAVTEHLIKAGSKGIITTHFTALKEFAYTLGGIENAAMQFDSATQKPLYSIKIGLAGASNALAICRRLGLNADILKNAESYLSDEGRAYDNILKRAEESRVQAQAAYERASALEQTWAEKTKEADKLIETLEKEKRSLNANARAETRRIINSRTERAEQLLGELEQIFAKEEISQTDLIRVRTLKNAIKNEGYEEENTPARVELYDLSEGDICGGMEVFVQSMQTRGVVLSYNKAKDEAEVACGSIKLRVKREGLKGLPKDTRPEKKSAPRKKEDRVKVVRKFAPTQPLFEINVIGKTVEEALEEVENFLDKALTDNLEKVKIIHGVGTGKLKNAIHARLKRHRGVKEFRSGVYGEGEIGVTIVTLVK